MSKSSDKYIQVLDHETLWDGVNKLVLVRDLKGWVVRVNDKEYGPYPFLGPQNATNAALVSRLEEYELASGRVPELSH